MNEVTKDKIRVTDDIRLREGIKRKLVTEAVLDKKLFKQLLQYLGYNVVKNYVILNDEKYPIENMEIIFKESDEK
ncbi:MAG: hypothetical protein RXP98_06850 [Thermoplasmata archaeon]